MTWDDVELALDDVSLWRLGMRQNMMVTRWVLDVVGSCCSGPMSMCSNQRMDVSCCTQVHMFPKCLDLVNEC